MPLRFRHRAGRDGTDGSMLERGALA